MLYYHWYWNLFIIYIRAVIFTWEWKINKPVIYYRYESDSNNKINVFKLNLQIFVRSD